MNQIYYYMTLFPTESFIASMLQPDQFGAYMAVGHKTGGHEQMIFASVEGGFGDDFDWEYAKQNTVPHDDDTPKNSLYLSTYRVLERIPLERINNLYLTTSDGRTLELTKAPFPHYDDPKPYYLYQDLAPINPLVISSFQPDEYGQYMVAGDTKITLPAICYCDLKVIDADNPTKTGNIGPMYNRNIGHLNECIKSVTVRGKKTKMLERTFAGRFTFQIVGAGFAIVNPEGHIWFDMPKREDLLHEHYDWGYSAMIL
jgi:hypothetical protein